MRRSLLPGPAPSYNFALDGFIPGEALSVAVDTTFIYVPNEIREYRDPISGLGGSVDMCN
jgi:hypothetical protein